MKDNVLTIDPVSQNAEHDELDNLYLLLASMLLEEQTKGEYRPFEATRRLFISQISQAEINEDSAEAVA